MNAEQLHNEIRETIFSDIQDFVLNTAKYFNRFRWSIDRLDDLFIGCIEEGKQYEILIFNRVRKTGEYRRTSLLLDGRFNIIKEQ